MIASLISRLLNEFLGMVIERPPKSSIDTAALRGHVTLSNLTLRRDAIDGLLFALGFPWPAPLDVVTGIIGEIFVDVPVRHLGSVCATVNVKNVNIVVRVKRRPVTGTDSSQSRAAALLKLLRSDGYMDKTMVRILANATVTVTNVNITVDADEEEPAPHPSPSVRFHIDTITMHSVNEAGEPAFIHNVHELRKVVAVRNGSMWVTLPTGDALVSSPLTLTCKMTLNSNVCGRECACVRESVY